MKRRSQLGNVLLLGWVAVTPVHSVFAQDRTTVTANPYESKELPSTGHPAQFKRFAAGQPGSGATAALQQRRQSQSAISPYIWLAGPNAGVNAAQKYFLRVQPLQTVYGTYGQVNAMNREVLNIGRRQELGTRYPETQVPQGDDGGMTPLQRRLRQPAEPSFAQMDESLKDIKEAQAESSKKEQDLLKEILAVLKALREDLKKPVDQKVPPEAGNE